ncbi:hypothetical protein Bca4012_062783 [Brassica carinata]
MMVHLAALFLAIIVSPLFVFSSENQQIGSDQHLLNDPDAAKLRISQLEAVLELTTQKVDANTLYLKEREKLIQDAESQILNLHASYSFESGLALVQERISELEEEVKLLWAALRTANFELHVLEDKARDAEGQVKATAFQVEQMTEVVTEQWIQVQHLEQMKEFNNRRNHVPTRCTLLKLMSDIRWEVKNASLFVQSCLTQPLSQLRSLWAAVTKYHHQLQGFIKHEMERNEITAALANSEVVFFMASALITFPVFGACSNHCLVLSIEIPMIDCICEQTVYRKALAARVFFSSSAMDSGQLPEPDPPEPPDPPSSPVRASNSYFSTVKALTLCQSYLLDGPVLSKGLSIYSSHLLLLFSASESFLSPDLNLRFSQISLYYGSGVLSFSIFSLALVSRSSSTSVLVAGLLVLSLGSSNGLITAEYSLSLWVSSPPVVITCSRGLSSGPSLAVVRAFTALG